MESGAQDTGLADRKNRILRVVGLIGIQGIATAIATILIRIVVVNNSSEDELRLYPTFMVVLTLTSVASFSVQERVVKTHSGVSDSADYPKSRIQKRGDQIIWLSILGLWIVLVAYQDTMRSVMGLLVISASLTVTNFLFASAQGLSLRNSDFRAYAGFPVVVVVLQGIAAVVLLRALNLSLFWFIFAATFTPLVVFAVRVRWNPVLRTASPFIFLSDRRIWKSGSSLLLVWLLVQWDQIYIPNCSTDWLAQDYVRFSTFSRIPLFIAAAVAPYVLKLNPARSVARFKETSLFFVGATLVLLSASIVLVSSHEIWFPFMFGRSVSLSLTELLILGLIHPLAGIALILSFRDLHSGATVTILAVANLPLVAGVTVGCGRLSGGSPLFDAAVVGGPLVVAVGLLAGRYLYGSRMIASVRQEEYVIRE